MNARHDQECDQYAPILGRQVATRLPCPDWCELPEGHPFETTNVDDNPLVSVDEARRAIPTFRIHRRRLGDRPTHVAVETYERQRSHGPSDLGSDPDATLVRLQLPHAHSHLTGEGARRLAEQLRAAAALVDAMTRKGAAR